MHKVSIYPHLTCKTIYKILFAFMLVVNFASYSYADDLVNGGNVSGIIEIPGDVDSYDFTVNEDEYVLISVVDTNNTNLYPNITVFDPSGEAVTSDTQPQTARLVVRAESSGVYRLTVRDNTPFTDNNTGVGAYTIHYVKAPGANEHGNLNNGGLVSEQITRGDIDSWTFEAEAGDYARLSLIDIDQGNLSPEIAVYAPDGSFITVETTPFVAPVSLRADMSGTYTVLVYDNTPFTGNNIGTGRYDLHYAKVPSANEHGILRNGDFVSEQITSGDIDSWTFEAEAGEYALLSLVDINQDGLFPEIAVYAPDGSFVTVETTPFVARVAVRADMSGTYTVLVYDNTPFTDNNSGTGEYDLHFVRVPSTNEHGVLRNGGFVSEQITSGDIDSWTFDAEAGDYALLSLVDINQDGLFPEIAVYAPDGSFVTVETTPFVARVAVRADMSGTYTVLVYDNTPFTDNNSGTGEYDLHFVRVPSVNEHGVLRNGGFVSEQITSGDIDSWTFDAEAGDYALLSLVDINQGSLSPEIALYAPDGSFVAVQTSPVVARVSMFAPMTGTYTVLVYDNTPFTDNNSGNGEYALHLARAPDSNEHGVLSGVGSVSETVSLGDIDSYQIIGSMGSPISLRITDVNNDTLSFRAILFTQTSGSIINVIDSTEIVISNFVLPEDGNYTLIIIDDTPFTGNDTGTGDYTVNFDVPIAPPEPEAPVAIISAPDNAFRNESIRLDAGMSFDPDNLPLPITYQWRVLNVPEGSQVSDASLSSLTDVISTFIADQLGNYDVELTVNDGATSSVTFSTISVLNRSPVADAGSPIAISNGSIAMLDASASFDPDGDMLSYEWQVIEQPINSDVLLSDPNSVQPSFTPTLDGIYVIGVSVSDGFDQSNLATVQISVTTANTPPTAIIEVLGSLEVGSEVGLDASQSSDFDGGPLALSYVWESIGALDADLQVLDEVNTSFFPQVAGTYSIRLSVSDGNLVDMTDVDIIVTEPVTINLPPEVDAGSDQSTFVNQQVVLNGEATNDPDNGPQPISLQWEFVSVPASSALTSEDIIDADTAQSSFVPDSVGVFVVQLTAFDGQDSGRDNVIITVEESIPVLRCDVDNSDSIDFNDIRSIARMIGNNATGSDDPADWNQDGAITVRDVRGCMTTCTLPRCAIVPN